jgi:hypothetical protein
MGRSKDFICFPSIPFYLGTLSFILTVLHSRLISSLAVSTQANTIWWRSQDQLPSTLQITTSH